MKKPLIVILAVVILAGAVLAILRFGFGGAEDTWICSGGQWVKHGNPSAPEPATSCGTTNNAVGNLNVQIQSVYEDKVVYSTDMAEVDIPALEADCARRGGEFNRCGSVCPSSAEFCIEVCALTCELRAAANSSDL